ncbi:type IV secretory system conjugative DNA transfer family protein [Roseateles toxinivorans]|uniref:Type IV secretion system coupling TraD/TrwB family protein n=1 Tax=Roseateles toxinivorans TaxID=270368 RepID=A0A4R6QFC2_9BURK|nr:DUF87 domain-containing protein [Roseateles toxinivorans]TDP60643.1 type IV secretion system coupling TraD/TrwB family protein [Roseateles toxinivorans]
MHDVSYFALTNGRTPHKRFGIKQADRLFHMHVIGKTGAGKSRLLETLIRQDIDAGRGVALIDPHGDLALRVLAYAKERRADVVYLDAADTAAPYGYNPLRGVSSEYVPLAVSGMMEVFKKRFADAWGVRMEHVLRNVLYAILESGGGTLTDVLLMLSDKDFRKQIVPKVKNEAVRAFWENEFPQYAERYRGDALAPIQNKIGAFLADPRMRRIVTAPQVDLSLRRIMDSSQILIINLSKGTIGEDSASLLGALLMTTFGLAAYSRANIAEGSRRPFFLYVDEFQSFTTLAVADMISELRKYRLALTVAHQHLHQLEEGVRHALIGNAGTLIAFRVGAEDARLLSKEFMEIASVADLVGQANYCIYLKLMIDGAPSRAFAATTIAL